jgi:hypothetical protein
MVMNIQQRKAALKQIADDAETLIQVSSQVMANAARLKSEATTALNELGGSDGRHRKVNKSSLNTKNILDIKGSITKGAKPYNLNS